MITIGYSLFAISFSGYYKKKDWQAWADKHILSSASKYDWLADVALSRNIDELGRALCELINSERENAEFAFSDAVIGFFYLQYLDKMFSLAELLNKSGNEADCGLGASEDCETFYELLNMLEKDSSLENNAHFLKRISMLYEPFKLIAEQQKEILENY